jgi:thioesterase domain-containing protein
MGYRHKALEGETEPLTQVEEMATHYIEAMRVRQPERPYFMGGASFGVRWLLKWHNNSTHWVYLWRCLQ